MFSGDASRDYATAITSRALRKSKMEGPAVAEEPSISA